jgi:hypothetical protein
MSIEEQSMFFRQEAPGPAGLQVGFQAKNLLPFALGYDTLE